RAHGNAVTLRVGDALDQSHELSPRFGIALEDAEHAAGEDAAVLFFDAAHLHAEVIGLDDHAHAYRFEVLLEALRNLPRHPLLELEAAAVQLHQPRQLAEADQPSIGDIADVHATE